MSLSEPKTVVEDWGQLRAGHRSRDLGRAKTLVVDPSSISSRSGAPKHLEEPLFVRPAANRVNRHERTSGPWVQRSLSRRESAGLVLLAVALVVALCWNPSAVEGEAASQAVLLSDPLPSERPAQQAVVSRLRGAIRGREERLARDQRAVLELLQQQRERRIAVRAREEAIAQLRGRRPDPELPLRLRATGRAELEDRASALLASGATEEALQFYRALSVSFPESTVYPAFVRVLESQLQCAIEPGGAGSPCR